MAEKGQQSGRRRIPTQERSRRRYDAIVDAAGQLFAEQGFDGTTMDAIAARAETSIGSVYQFFGDKVDVFRAVAERCLENSRTVFAELIAGAADATWEEALDRAVDAFYELQERVPAYRAIWTNLQLYGEYAEADEALVREIVDGTAGLLTLWVPDQGPEKRKLIAKMSVSTISSMLIFTARESQADARAMVKETKRMLRAYYRLYLPEAETSSGSR